MLKERSGLKLTFGLVALFNAFLIGTSFLKERSDRQMFALRQQLKIQYRATQSAQVMERRASDSKKRFVSYSQSSLLTLRSAS